jgi:hypothetical protein
MFNCISAAILAMAHATFQQNVVVEKGCRYADRTPSLLACAFARPDSLREPEG